MPGVKRMSEVKCARCNSFFKDDLSTHEKLTLLRYGICLGCLDVRAHDYIDNDSRKKNTSQWWRSNMKYIAMALINVFV